MSDKLSENLITIQATPSELIAIGHLIYTYRLRLKNMPTHTQGQRELLELLESFQRRVAIPTRMALDLSATPEPWQRGPRQKKDGLPLFAFRQSVARLKSFFLLLKKASHKDS